MTVMPRIGKSQSALRPILGLAGPSNVRTPCGLRRIENVRPGDLIVTRDNGLQPVRMVWTRGVSAADAAADPSLAPVRLKRRAIGPMMPQQDLCLAGQHRILVPGYRLAEIPDDRSCLIAARDIAEASDEAFVDKSCAEVTFYNLVFEEHQVFAANGLPVESYLPSQASLRELDDDVSKDIAALFDGGTECEPGFPAARYGEPDLEGYRPAFV